MHYKEFTEEFAARTGRSKRESKRICDQILGLITEIMTSDGELDIYGFGRLDVFQSAPRKVISFDGDEFHVKGRKKIRFHAGSSLERALNGGDPIDD